MSAQPIPTRLAALAEFARKVLATVPRQPRTDHEKALAWTALVCGLIDKEGNALPDLESPWRDEDDDTPDEREALKALRAFALGELHNEEWTSEADADALFERARACGLVDADGHPTPLLTGESHG